MGTNFLTVSSTVALVGLTLAWCDTPVGQGATWGAATGAIIGGAALVMFAPHQLAQPQEPLRAH